MPKTLYELEQWALAEFQSVFFEGSWATDDDEAIDLISEISDSRTPRNTHEVLEIAWVIFGLYEINDTFPKTSVCMYVQSILGGFRFRENRIGEAL